MKINLSYFAALSAIYILSGCGTPKKSVALDPVVVSAASDQYKETAPRNWDILHSRVSLSFDYTKKTAAGQEWMQVKPYFYGQDTLILDAKSMYIDTVAIQRNSALQVQRFIYENDKLVIPLNRKYSSSDTLSLYIRYVAMPYNAPVNSGTAVADDRGLYFINTDYKIPGKPAQIWTQGETEANSHWLPTIDKPNERFTAQIELTVPDSFTTLSNGYLKQQIPLAKGFRKDIWVMDQPIQTYAYMLTVGRFVKVEDESWNGKPVDYYVEPEYEQYAKRMFQHTPEMIDFFSRITGVPYPWNKYSQIVVRDYVSGAMENTTASLYGEFMNQNFREMADKDYEDIVSHELFHQWFGDYVTAESWSNITLSESFANYGEQLWRRYKYGYANAEELAYEDLQQYLTASRNSDPELVRYYYKTPDDVFDRISYQKGGAILKYLHGLIGDEAFYKAMNIYLTKNALSSAEAAQWRMAVEEATGKDWNWFFNQWYMRGGHPQLSIDYDYDETNKKVFVSIAQKQKDVYTLPLKALVVYNNKIDTIDWMLNKAKLTLSYPYINGEAPVIVPDAFNWLPGTIQENKQLAQWVKQYRLVNNVISKLNALDFISEKPTATMADSIISLALADTSVWMRTTALEVLQNITKESDINKWRNKVQFIAMNDASTKPKAAAFILLGKWKTKSVRNEMIEALSSNSYQVAGSALYALNAIDKDTAYQFASSIIRKDDTKAALQNTALDVIAAKGTAADIEIFKAEQYKVYGSQKIYYSASLATYIVEVKDYEAFKQANILMQDLIAGESIKIYRQAMASYFFEAASNFKKKYGTSKGGDVENKLAVLRKTADEIIARETDTENKRLYRQAYSSIF
jgi:aminopeptidase N